MEAEGRGDCESLDRTSRREVLRQRVHEGSLWRRVGQWRRAGVMEHGEITPRRPGSCQGGPLTHPRPYMRNSIDIPMNP